MMRSRRQKTGGHGDIHENDEDYLVRCRQCALLVAEKYGWHVINCANGGAARAIDEIHQEIWDNVEPLLQAEKG